MEFFKLLAILLKDKNLTRSDVCVMSVIVTYAQYEENQITEMSANDIHEIFETICIKTIRRCIKHLAELNYIEIIKQAAPKKNQYRVLIDIPKGQAQSQIRQKKNSNKITADDEYIANLKRAALQKPFLQ